MKKFLMILVCLILVSTVAIGEAVDFSSMSDEELEGLYASILIEMDSRKLGNGVLVPEGEYVVGIDIPVGDYLISSAEPDKDTWLYVCDSKEAWSNYETKKEKMIDYCTKESYFYKFLDGDYIIINNSPAFFLEYSLGF